MLKIRVIPTLLYRDVTLVKGVGFDGRRVVGSPMQAVQVYNLRNVDELCFFDITASMQGRGPDFSLIDELADRCFMPLTVGGGVASLDDVRDLLAVGADKVAINTAALDDPELVRAASERFGAQCIVAVVDTRADAHGTVTVWRDNATRDTGLDPAAWAKELEALGAGEVLLQSADHDGVMQGYDLETIRRVSDSVSVPVIASGGAGTYEHLHAALVEGRASAVAAASMFHFTEQTPMGAKEHLGAHGHPVRH
jgi:cyclase